MLKTEIERGGVFEYYRVCDSFLVRFDLFAVPTRNLVYILFLNADGSVKTITQLESPIINDPTFGTSIVGVGDLDGDTVPDLAVGSPRCFTRDRNSTLSKIKLTLSICFQFQLFPSLCFSFRWTSCLYRLHLRCVFE